MRTQRKTTAALLIAAVVANIGLVACGTTTVTKQPESTAPSQSVLAESTPTKPTEATPAPETPESGPVETTFAVSGTSYTNASEKAYSYEVTLSKVEQQAAPADEFSGASAGKHLVGLKFKVTGTKGVTDDNAFNNTSVQGSDDQIYEASITGNLAAGTTFNNGQINLSAGEHATGWVPVEVPDGVQVTTVYWTPGLGGEKATWTIG